MTKKILKIAALTLIFTVYAIFSPFVVLNVYSELNDCVNLIDMKCESWRFEDVPAPTEAANMLRVRA